MRALPVHGPETVGSPALRDTLTGVSMDRSVPLVWRRTAPGGSASELLQGARVFGEMEPALRNGADAVGEILGRPLELRLERRLLALRGIRVDTFREDGEVGPTYRGSFFNWGKVWTPGGEVLSWDPRPPRLYRSCLRDASGTELLRLRPAFLRLLHTETRVEIRPAGWARRDLPELLLLAWFLRLHSESRGRVFQR